MSVFNLTKLSYALILLIMLLANCYAILHVAEIMTYFSSHVFYVSAKFM